MKSNFNIYFSSVFIRVLSMLLSIIIGIFSVPISLKFWGTEKYGLLALLNSILVYLSISNFGLGSASSILIGKNSDLNIKLTILKKSFYLLSAISFLFLILFLLVNSVSHDWVYLLGNIDDNLYMDAYYSSVFIIVFFFIKQPLSVINSVYFGFNKQYVFDFFELLNILFSFGRLIVAINLNLELYKYILLVSITDLVISLIKGLYAYLYIIKKVKIENENNSASIGNIHEVKSKYIIRTSINFFLMGLAAMVSTNSDNFIISHTLGIEYIAKFTVTYSLYKLAFNFIGMINNAFLPILSKELSHDNQKWIQKKYHFLLVINMTLGGVILIGSLNFMIDVLNIWVGIGNYAGYGTILFLGLYSYLLSIIGLNSGILNTLNLISGTHFIYWSEAFVNIAVSIIMIKYFGLSGTAFGTLLAGLIPYYLLQILIVKRSNNKIDVYFNTQLKHFFKTLFPTILLSLLSTYLDPSLPIRIVVGIFILIFYLYNSFKLFSSNEKMELLLLIKKFTGVQL